MEWLKNIRHRLAVSVLAGLLAVSLMQGTAGERCGQEMTAWWGVLYPGFCFSGKQQEAEEEEDDGKPVRIKISFWLAKALDW